MRFFRFAIVLVSCGVFAGEYKPLKGDYSIAGKSFYDPPASEPQDTHIYFALEGKSAKDLYDSMKVKAVRDMCTDDGSMSKHVGEMQCTRSKGGKEHQCWFGIDIKSQKVVGGVVC
jgi:hypothetical protein